MSKKVGKKPPAVGPDQSLPVYTMPHDEQVDLLAQALLREYMHKKGFKGTLAAFDDENPRDDRTISSRAVMGDLMALDKPRQEELKSKGVDTIMEALCYTRAEKRERAVDVANMKHLLAEGELALQNFPTLPEEEEGGTSKKGKKAKKEKDEKGGKKGKKNKNKVLSIDELLDQDTPLGSKKKKKSKSPELKPTDIVIVRREVPESPLEAASSTSSLRKLTGGRTVKRNVQFSDNLNITMYDPHSDDASPEHDAAVAAKKTMDLLNSNPLPSKRLAPLSTIDLVAPEESSEGTSSASDSDDSTPSKDGDYADVVARNREEEDRTLRERHMRREGSGGNLIPRSAWGATPDRRPSSDIGTPSPQSSVASSAPSPLAGSPSSSASNMASAPKPNALGNDLAAELMVLLVGGDRRIPSSFMNQGFYFNEAPAELQFGLLQNEGGCCGVLAAVQAMVIARFIGNHFIITPDVQRNFLLSALTDILLIVQPSLEEVRLVTAHPAAYPPAWDSKGNLSDQRRLIATQFVLNEGFTTRSELEEALGAVIPHCAFGSGQKTQNPSSWCEPHGYGLICFLLSCVLSHGLRAVSNDMDVQSPIIVEHGYCSQEIVNLLLCGKASSNVHDGVLSHGSMDLKGLVSPSYHPSIAERAGTKLLVGFLSALEPKGMLEVGSLGKDPALPVWIVYNESHYTVAWLPRDERESIHRASPTSEDPSLDVHYYDQQGGQDEDIRLTLTLDDMPLPAVHRDALIPYLNPILRTIPDWSLAKISWNGTDPLL